MEFIDDVAIPGDAAPIASLVRLGVISKNSSYFLNKSLQRNRPGIKEFLASEFSSDKGRVDIVRKAFEFISVEAEQTYTELFNDVPYEVGKTLANKDRLSSDNPGEQSLLYGEIEFGSFLKLLKKIKPSRGGIFYDLGSGTGKAVLTARLLCDYDLCVGLELLESLHQQAEIVNTKYEERYKCIFGKTALHQVSILEYDWSNGDVIFANSTNFGPALMQAISEQAASLKPGTIVVTFTKPIISPRFEMLEEFRSKMSWGRATIYIQRRLCGDYSPSGPSMLYQFPEDVFSYSKTDATLLCQYLLHRRREKLRRQQQAETTEGGAAATEEAATAEAPVIVCRHTSTAVGQREQPPIMAPNAT